jgi:hypothetical protein
MQPLNEERASCSVPSLSETRVRASHAFSRHCSKGGGERSPRRCWRNRPSVRREGVRSLCSAQGANGGGSRGDWEQLLDAELEPAQFSGTEATSAGQQGRSVVLTYPDGTTEIRSGGSVAWRTNNPGNLVQGPFARSHGSIGQYRNLGHNIAVFPSEAAGQGALESRLTTPPFSRWTLNRAISVYAPPSVNPTARYQAFVAGRLGVSGSTTLGSLSPSQISTLAGAIRGFEGWTPGRVAVGWGL